MLTEPLHLHSTQQPPQSRAECLQPYTPWAMAFTPYGLHCPQPLASKQRCSTPNPPGPSCAASSQQQGAHTAHSWPLALTNPRPKPRDWHIAFGGQQVRLTSPMGTLHSTVFRKRGQRESQPSWVEWQGHILATRRCTKAPKKVTPQMP